MAKKLSVDLELSTKGYVASIKEAKGATADYTTAVNISNEQIKSLNREVKAAQKEAIGLAQAYNRLTAAQKDSAGGQAMKRQLEEAKKYAAELFDVSQDARNEIKNMASDTAGWDAAKQGIDIVKSATLSYASAIAKLTGDEESLKDVIATLTFVENAFATAIKIGNALQKQSALMTGIRKVQSIAMAKAIKAETTATKGATAAQRVFNAVAKANPYVLLATAIIAVTTALGAYMFASRKAADEEDKFQKKLTATQEKIKDISDTYDSSYATSLGNTISKYKQLQAAFNALATNKEKEKWIKDNKRELDSLEISVKNVHDAERIFNGDTNKIVEAFKLRARAAAEAARNASLYVEKIKLTERATANAVQFKAGEKVQSSDISRYNLEEGKDYTQNKNKIGDYTFTAAGAAKASAAAIAKDIQITTGEIDKELQASDERLKKDIAEYNKTLSTLGVSDAGTGSTGGGKAYKTIANSIVDLENKITHLQNLLKHGLVPADKVKETLTTIKNLQEQVKQKKIELGFDTESIKSNLDNLKAEITKKEAELELALSDEDVKKIQGEIKDLKRQAEAEEIRLGIKISDRETIAKQTKEAIENATKEAQPQISFEGFRFDIKNSGKEDIANDVLARFNALGEVIDNFNSQMNELDAGDSKIAALQAALEELLPVYQQLSAAVIDYKTQSDEALAKNEKIAELRKNMSNLGGALNTTASAFGSLAQITDEPVFDIMGTIAQAIANVALSYSQAMMNPKDPWSWIAFAIAGLATMMSTIAGIKSATSGAYAEGGVIGGHSYYGDKLMARVNSGEAILNTRQQQRALELMDGHLIDTASATQVYVEGVIRGKDLLLVQRNYNAVSKKAGQSIKIY